MAVNKSISHNVLNMVIFETMPSRTAHYQPMLTIYMQNPYPQ